MKANELRVGNLVHFFMSTREEKVVEITPRWFCSLSAGKPDSEQREIGASDLNGYWSGIALTEEWLLKFGFRKGSLFFSKAEFEFYFNDGDNGNWYPVVGGSVSVEYVHQLQNLFYALTGEELTI